MATIKIVLVKRKLTNNQFPISLRLSVKNQSATYIRLDGLYCSPHEWNNENSRFKRNKTAYIELNTALKNIEARAESILSQLLAANKFSYKKFRAAFEEQDNSNSVIYAFDKKINELEILKKYGSAKVVGHCKTAFLEFTKTNDTTFDEIDYKFLTDYRTSRLKKGNKLNTVSIYFRGLRAIHYEYCKLNNISRPDAYLNAGIPNEPTRKRALTKQQLTKLLGYKCKSLAEQRSIDIFMFSFYARGMSIKDIAKLKPSSIVNDRIEYRRSKTSTLFSIPVSNEMRLIINKYKTSEFLFPIIKTNEMKDVANFNRAQNKILKRIGSSLKLPHFSGYAARHSYASVLRQNGVNIDLISQSLGHADIKTTSVYLSSFENKVLDEVSNNLI